MKVQVQAFIGLAILLTAVLCEKVRYDDYKVYRVVPQTEEERAGLLQFEKNNQGVQFWKGVSRLNQPVGVMVPPHLQSVFESTYVDTNSMIHSVYIENVQTVLDEDALGIKSEGRPVDWRHYSRLSDIYRFYNKLAKDNPSTVKVLNIGKSTQKRDLKVVKVSKSGRDKPAIWYDSNLHAREWISGASCTYVLNQLVNSKDSTIVQMTMDFDFYVMCMANPDGYEYSHKVDRLWRKTRSITKTIGCYGADPNRNWDFQWMKEGASDNPCDEDYGGPKPFSEPETKAMADFYTSIAHRFISYLTVHSYSQLILIPYGFTAPKYPGFEDDLRIGKAAANALSQRYGTKFKVGNTVDILYPASGGSDDWAKGVHNTSLVFTYELRDKGKYGFLLPAKQIIPSSLELLDSLIEIAAQLRVRLQKLSRH